MKHLWICFLLLHGMLIGNVCAGEIREIVLHDGSIITAEILALREGVYTLKSEGLGTITIEAAKVRTIRLYASAKSPREPDKPETDSVEAQMHHLQQSMMHNPEIMRMISSLLQHPDVQAVLADPAIMQAVRTNDLNTLLSHPKFMQLLDNPTIRDIGKQTMP
jgi:hypothetical protein